MHLILLILSEIIHLHIERRRTINPEHPIDEAYDMILFIKCIMWIDSGPTLRVQVSTFLILDYLTILLIFSLFCGDPLLELHII